MLDESPEGLSGAESAAGGAESSPEAGSFNWDGFAREAGLTPDTDPVSVKEALDFQRSSKGKHVLSDEERQQWFQEEHKKWFENADNVALIENYFTQLYKDRGLLRDAEEGIGEGDVGANGLGPAAQRQIADLSRMVEGLVTNVQELREGSSASMEKQKAQGWARNFDASLRDAVRRHSNSLLDAGELGDKVRRRYITREETDDSPAGIRQAVRRAVERETAAARALIQKLGIEDTVRQKLTPPVPLDAKIGDIVQDDDKMHRLLTKIINEGMPADDDELNLSGAMG